MTTEEASISSSSGERLSSPMHVDDDDETTLQQNFEALKVKAAALHQEAAAKAAMVADALTRAEAIRKVMPFKKIMKKLASERLASHHITFNVCNPVIWSADELAAMNDNPDVVDIVGSFFRQQSFFIALGHHVVRYKEQERAVLISLCDDTDMANFLTKAVQHRFHDEKQWRNYGSITIFNRPHGTSHVAIKYRNEELPVSLLVLPSPPSSTDVTTAPTLPGAERSSAPLSRTDVVAVHVVDNYIAVALNAGARYRNNQYPYHTDTRSYRIHKVAEARNAVLPAFPHAVGKERKRPRGADDANALHTHKKSKIERGFSRLDLTYDLLGLDKDAAVLARNQFAIRRLSAADTAHHLRASLCLRSPPSREII
ncbi:hypothetical protein SeMB42_g02043 [Synchytrium endobioticum]|uniref:Uncharacterized protein n=1 Tax=Synchytrium endobioticum TaxID=286115 RepID=A0A507DHY8_9FUNG|nr:hypothetical protein SeMB42_g02043 [Synchytrium endobioticum]